MELKKTPNKYLINIYKDPNLEYFRIMKIINLYFSDYQKQYVNLRQEVVDYEYALGSKYMHRGYYCPSSIQDIVIGGPKRGRISKTLPPPGKAEYRYGFNEDGQLIIAETPGKMGEKEIIRYENDSVLGITIRMDDEIPEEIMQYTECRYEDGKVKSCIMVDTPMSRYNRFDEYTREDYHYSENGLDYVEVIKFGFWKSSFVSPEDIELWIEESESGECEDFEIWCKNKNGD